MAVPPHKVAIIGVGRKGTSHARAYMLHPRCEVIAAADPDPQNLDLFQRRFGVSNVYSDYRDLLANERIDIAAPILPVSVNPEVVIACAQAGVRAVFSEKPIAASLEEADQMVEECRSRGIPFACGDAWRNLPQFWQFKSMIDDGEVGEVRSINIYHPHDEISGGGCQSLGVMRLMAGDADVEWVTGWVRGDPFDEEDQGMGGVVRFSNGIDAFIHMNPVGKLGIEVNTSRGVFFSDWKTFRLWLNLEDGRPFGDGWPDNEVYGAFEDADNPDDEFGDDGLRLPGYRQTASVDAIVRALEEGREPWTSGDNMRKALEIGVALRESHRRGHAPVRLPIEDRSLRILPHAGRWLNKKQVYGEEWYAEQMAAKTRLQPAESHDDDHSLQLIEEAQQLLDSLQPYEKASYSFQDHKMEAKDMAWEAFDYQMKVVAKQRGWKYEEDSRHDDLFRKLQEELDDPEIDHHLFIRIYLLHSHWLIDAERLEELRGYIDAANKLILKLKAADLNPPEREK